MGDNIDLALDHDLANNFFLDILDGLPEIIEEDKQKMMNAFQTLSYFYKNRLLVKLENMSRERNAQSNQIKLIESFLFDDRDQTMLEISDRNAVKTSLQLVNEAETTAIPPVVNQSDITSLADLEKLTGLDNVKLEVRKLVAATEIAKVRKEYNLKSFKQSLHMIFKGNPGTGKTTVARALGNILKEIGVLSIGHVIELDRSNLISKYQGDIEKNIVKYAEQAKGGILFIDEIYSLYPQGDNNDQGKQGIEVLLKVMEDRREDFICIGAGYINEVDAFLNSNPGLMSRFSIHINFDDYTDDQLLSIARNMLEDFDYIMEDSFAKLLHQFIQKERHTMNFANARMIRNVVESAIREQSLRLFDNKVELNEKSLMAITGDDFKQ